MFMHEALSRRTRIMVYNTLEILAAVNQYICLENNVMLGLYSTPRHPRQVVLSYLMKMNYEL